jgi:hypothetical protein
VIGGARRLNCRDYLSLASAIRDVLCTRDVTREVPERAPERDRIIEE